LPAHDVITPKQNAHQQEQTRWYPWSLEYKQTQLIMPSFCGAHYYNFLAFTKDIGGKHVK
jgi:hypothetical protein